jgi:hypothetical protein
MGREVRKVPPTWEHPENKPLRGRSFEEDAEKWDIQKIAWDCGLYLSNGELKRRDSSMPDSFDDWDGKRPEKEDYMPNWPESERTHYQMYETTTLGTPISPPMPTIDSLAHWLADNNASAAADFTCTYEEWLRFICLNLYGRA